MRWADHSALIFHEWHKWWNLYVCQPSGKRQQVWELKWNGHLKEANDKLWENYLTQKTTCLQNILVNASEIEDYISYDITLWKNITFLFNVSSHNNVLCVILRINPVFESKLSICWWHSSSLYQEWFSSSRSTLLLWLLAHLKVNNITGRKKKFLCYITIYLYLCCSFWFWLMLLLCFSFFFQVFPGGWR